MAVIGDGAITGGMAFEAMNCAGYLGVRHLVILNDNGQVGWVLESVAVLGYFSVCALVQTFSTVFSLSR